MNVQTLQSSQAATSITDHLERVIDEAANVIAVIRSITVTEEAGRLTIGTFPDGKRAAIDSRWIYNNTVEQIYIFDRSVDGGPHLRDSTATGSSSDSPMAKECSRHNPGETWTSKWQDGDEPLELHEYSLVGKFEVMARHGGTVIMREVAHAGRGLKAIETR